MAKEIIFTFVREGVSARARLLEEEAPETCRAIWDMLPVSRECFHAMYSGTCAAIFLDPRVKAPDESTTTFIQTGDVLFTHYEPGFRHGHPEPVSEIYWAYDRYVRPTIPGVGLPATANVFAQFVGDTATFYALSRATHREGIKQLEVRRAE